MPPSSINNLHSLRHCHLPHPHNAALPSFSTLHLHPNNMRNQKRESVASAIGRKRARKEVQKLKVKEEKPEEQGSECRDSGSAQNDPGWTLTHWDDHCYDWLWLGSIVDYEQMSWGSVWDMGLAGEAFSKLYGDVVWDDDIWNLRTQIPNSSYAK